MNKNLRTVKTGMILGLVLISMFAVFIPNASAGPIKVKPIITVTFSPSEKNVIPDSGVLVIPLETTFALGGIGASTVETSSLLKDTPILIQLKVENTESWVTASIENSQVQLKIGQNAPYTSYLSITVTGEAPVFQQGIVRISATSQEQPGLLFTIAQVTSYFDVSFQVGYWPVISDEEPKGTSVYIGPMDNANIPIVFSNLGNGLTELRIEITNIPDGWSANIAGNIQLNSAALGNSEGTTRTADLVIKPPHGFGFHDDVYTFYVSYTPYYPGQTNLSGPTKVIPITIQSIGFSLGLGYELPSIIIVLIVIALVIYLYMRRKK